MVGRGVFEFRLLSVGVVGGRVARRAVAAGRPVRQVLQPTSFAAERPMFVVNWMTTTEHANRCVDDRHATLWHPLPQEIRRPSPPNYEFVIEIQIRVVPQSTS